MSRAQARKLIGKIISRDSLFYRKLTDKPIDGKQEGTETKSSETKPSEIKPSESETTEIDFEALSKGNRIYLPIFKTSKDESEIQSDISKNGLKSEVIDSETGLYDYYFFCYFFLIGVRFLGMVTYKGGLIDIDKLMEQMKRSEKARDETEQLLVDLRKTNAELVTSNNRAKDKIKDLQSSLKSSNRKLNDTEQTLSIVNVS